MPADATRFLHAAFGPIHVINTYVPQGRDIAHPMYQYKLQWFQRLRSYFESHFSPRTRIVWLGDMNVAPLPIDIHNAHMQENHVCYHADARNAFSHALEWGFTDIFRKHHPEPEQYTFFDYRTRNAVARKMGWRVDHILATEPLAKTSVDSYIDLKPRMEQRPSDHTFLVAEFKV